MLKEIAIVTIAVANIGQVEDSWREEFGYTTVERGEISVDVAVHWKALAMAGEDYVIMQPANEPGVYVRLIDEPAAAQYRPMTSTGWNATELLVRDPDTLAEQLADSAFEVIGPPRDLWPAPNAPRIMQALGPGNELLYLTRNTEAAAALGLDKSMPEVERPFIMVAGGPSMSDFVSFYADRLGLKVDPPQPFAITMISKANDLPLDTTYPLAVVNLAPGYLIEVDELPPGIGAREVEVGRLPPGVAIVSLTADSMPAGDFDWVTRPHEMNEFPYSGRAVGLLRGPAGELIEIIAPAGK